MLFLAWERKERSSSRRRELKEKFYKVCKICHYLYTYIICTLVTINRRRRDDLILHSTILMLYSSMLCGSTLCAHNLYRSYHPSLFVTNVRVVKFCLIILCGWATRVLRFHWVRSELIILGYWVYSNIITSIIYNIS